METADGRLCIDFVPWLCVCVCWGHLQRIERGSKTTITSPGTKKHICAKVNSKSTVKTHSSFALFLPKLLRCPYPPQALTYPPCFKIPPPLSPPSVPLCGRWALCVTAGSLGHIHMGQGSPFVCL